MPDNLEVMHVGCSYCDTACWVAKNALVDELLLVVDVMLTDHRGRVHRGCARRYDERPF